MIQIILFSLITITVFFIAGKKFWRIRRNILLGKEKDLSGDFGQRFKNMTLVAFGQKKMFKRFIPAILHLFIYVAFLFTTIELIEILIDGFTGQHRFFANMLGSFYTFLISFIEGLSVLAFIATIIFLSRRNLLKLPRFTKAEMLGWPTKDGNLILLFEIILLVAIFTMNGADTVLQSRDTPHYPDTGFLLVSSWLGPMLFDNVNTGSLIIIERIGWWAHLLMVFGFMLYLPFSKHLHIFLAFPNVFYASLTSRGEMENMESIMNEVKSMMGLTEDTGSEAPMDDLPSFGAKDIFDLSWKNLMDAYTCTECGRCTSVCPANQTGKKLSPRKIMMDVRDRVEEVATALDVQNDECKIDKEKALTKDNFDDGKSLFDLISREEIHACTTCNACVEACPVMIDPLEIILDLRRYEILTESAGPADWMPMFNSVENNGAVWQLPNSRAEWKDS